MQRQEFLETRIKFGTDNGTSLEFHEASDRRDNVGLTVRQANDVKLAEGKPGAYIRREVNCLSISPNSAAVLADLFEEAAPLLREFAKNGTIARPAMKEYVENPEATNNDIGIADTLLSPWLKGDGPGDSDI
jgi:hypothetical protein